MRFSTFILLLLFYLPMEGQNDVVQKSSTIKGLHYSATLIYKNGVEKKGIICLLTDSTLFLTKLSYFRYLEGKKRTLSVVKSALYEAANYKYSFQEFPLQNLLSVEVRKRRSNKSLRRVTTLIGLGIGAGFGVILSFPLESPLIIPFSTGIFTLAGLGVGTILSLRMTNKKVIYPEKNERWREVLLPYSIL